MKKKLKSKKAAKALAGFLFAMLFFTLLSRGLYAYRMPRIAVGQASVRSISKTFRVKGVVAKDKRKVFKASLTKEEAAYLKAGDTVRLLLQDETIAEEGCTVLAVKKYEASVDLSGSGNRLPPGMEGVMEIEVASGQYSSCVPLSAVYTDGNKNYVLLVREAETIFGTELTAVRRDVVVADQNESVAALKDGMLDMQDVLIVYADRQVQPGDKVRLLEDEDT